MDKRLLRQCTTMIQRHKIEIIDLKCIDLPGVLRHISLPVHPGLLELLVREGVGFDGSSYGFRKVENSDMILIPDLRTAVVDPFRATPTLSFYANIHLADDARTPFSQDGRGVARKAEDLLRKTLGADTSHWGPEFEFYIFSVYDSTRAPRHHTTRSSMPKSFSRMHTTRPIRSTSMMISATKHARC